MRSIALILLFFLFALIAGPAIAGVVAPTDDAEKSCCSGCAEEESAPDSVPCSTGDCPLLLCLAADLAEPVVLQTASLAKSFTFLFVPQLFPDPFVKLIFHPPIVD